MEGLSRSLSPSAFYCYYCCCLWLNWVSSDRFTSLHFPINVVASYDSLRMDCKLIERLFLHANLLALVMNFQLSSQEFRFIISRLIRRLEIVEYSWIDCSFLSCVSRWKKLCMQCFFLFFTTHFQKQTLLLA